MKEFFGDFSETLPPSQEYLVIQFSPSSFPLQQRWRNNGLSADFIADYLTTFFPNHSEGKDPDDHKAHIKSAVSYIANELIENAMKFSDRASPHPISITLRLYRDCLVFETTNSISPQDVQKFQLFIQDLTASDPQDMYVRQLEASLEDEASAGSGLGILTMMVDYLAKIGWKFEDLNQDTKTMTVTTMVTLSISEL